MAFVENKKAHFDYEFLETYSAGAELFGYEVKAIRAGKASLLGARVLVRGGEVFLVGASISPYQEKNTPASYDPERARRLLLSKKEILELAEQDGKRGLTIIPIKWYNGNRKVKLEFAVARHKKRYDKRALLKAKDTKRHIDRTLKGE
ncbi:SsrA-binding protein [Candidatus Kaiserbacteria bacterium CG10_big_fil_rev_8_21_14_0_10_45_20]|uniref:SsrA-binding protein n=1 Tax=Candidatus Kaiserbacteria bacterium CG10_big_fil_rev_8_21_14_0_10_45_20 TaxID=1974607 RepID=A0A2H0UFJ6_9BACT|nr:MAG: SsrA-binding protein [Candidatus Kaiserbacteria bacterium CG10_big_fil_rev_8_21_14_0_10_45_20]